MIRVHFIRRVNPAAFVVMALNCALASPTLFAQAVAAAPHYETIAPSPDGIGRRYMGREIAGIMGWQGAEWLERAEREQEERTDLLLPELKLTPGMKVADIGAGTGYIARRMVKQVGQAGVVMAVDVQPEMIRMLSAMEARESAEHSAGARYGYGRPAEAGQRRSRDHGRRLS